MKERHNILSHTIGYFSEEQQAMDTGCYLLIGSFTMVIVGSLLEAWFFWLYNGSFHPFANILKDPVDATKCKILILQIAMSTMLNALIIL